MGRKGPRAKTKTVLKSVKQWEQHGSMPKSKKLTFLNKNHPNHPCSNVKNLKHAHNLTQTGVNFKIFIVIYISAVNNTL